MRSCPSLVRNGRCTMDHARPACCSRAWVARAGCSSSRTGSVPAGSVSGQAGDRGRRGARALTFALDGRRRWTATQRGRHDPGDDGDADEACRHVVRGDGAPGPAHRGLSHHLGHPTVRRPVFPLHRRALRPRDRVVRRAVHGPPPRMGAQLHRRRGALDDAGVRVHVPAHGPLPPVLARRRGLPGPADPPCARSAEPLGRAVPRDLGDPGGGLRPDRPVRPHLPAALRGLAHRPVQRPDAPGALRRLLGAAALPGSSALVLHDADVGICVGHARRPHRDDGTFDVRPREPSVRNPAAGATHHRGRTASRVRLAAAAPAAAPAATAAVRVPLGSQRVDDQRSDCRGGAGTRAVRARRRGRRCIGPAARNGPRPCHRPRRQPASGPCLRRRPGSAPRRPVRRTSRRRAGQPSS